MNIFFFFQGPVPVDKKKEQTLESVMNSNRAKRHYFGDGENDYVDGACTYNVGIAKAVLKMIKKSKFDNIIYAYDDFRDVEEVNKAVDEELGELCKDLVPVHYSKDDDSDTILKSICMDQGANDSFKEGNTVYIASNSGIRSNVMFFSTFSQILDCRKVTTELYYESNGEVKDSSGKSIGDKVKNITDTNKYYEILRGIELFTETGNPTKLINSFRDNKNEKLNELFALMTRFYENIQVCRRVENNGLLDTYKLLKSKLNELKDDAKLPVTLKLLLPSIERSFVDRQVKRGGVEDIELIHIIKWCLKNKLIAQAYFILNVELVSFLMEKNILKNNFPNKERIKQVIGDSFKETHYKYYKSPKSLPVDNMDIIMKSYVAYISEHENEGQILQKFGFEFSDYQICNKAIMICTLVRRIRNSMAHSNNYDIIEDYKCLIPMIDVYNKDYVSRNSYLNRKGIYTMIKKIANGSEEKSIPASSEDFYDICEYFLNKILVDIKELCKNI